MRFPEQNERTLNGWFLAALRWPEISLDRGDKKEKKRNVVKEDNYLQKASD